MRRARRRLGPAVFLAAVPLVLSLASPTQAAPSGGHAPTAPAQHAVPVSPVHGTKVSIPAMKPWKRPAVSWPAAGSATATLKSPSSKTASPRTDASAARPGPADVRLGSLPIWAGPTVATSKAATSKAATSNSAAENTVAPSRLSVSMASQKTATALGVTGVVFSVSRADGLSAAGQVHLSLNYSSFAYANGGNYAARLRLVALPACALTTPQVAACRVQRPLQSSDDVAATSLGADVTLPGTSAPRSAAANVTGTSAATHSLVLAAATTTSGSSGDFTASSLSEAGDWSVGGSNGSFDFSYPIDVPPVPGGLQPDVSLGYDSQAIDGLTSSTNDQASWIGDGWDYSPGFVERNYQSCELNSGTKSGDFCWSSNDSVTVSLNGANTTLVQDSSGAWHPEADDGQKVSYLTGTSNGTHDGGYWVITETDGTSYYFGMNQLPGYASGDATTNSAWTTPVYAPSSGQPCYNSTYADSYCNQAWRWNLDYVTDAHGDAIAYYYNTETNYYSRDNGTTANTSYTQSGALSKIEYGLRAGTVYGTTPAAQVNFTTTESRTDFPSDLACTNGKSCDVISPTFWGKYQLTTISTQSLVGSSLKNVDSWALAQSYPSTGDTTTPASLWLSSIKRTGEDGTAASLPPVSFAGSALPNRIESKSELSGGYSIITRLRLTSITNETGGVTSVNYLAPSGGCTSGSLPAPDDNTLLCYPDYWTPPGDSSPILDWFNKYVVDEVSQQDITGGAPPLVTSYSYQNAAWHYDDDALTRSKNRTWDQWRGYQSVTTETGAATSPDTKTVDTYFQGMDGDYQANGTTASASVSSTQGDSVPDSKQYNGMQLEHLTYDGPGGGMVSDVVTLPWSSGATATQSQPSPLPALTAYRTGEAKTKTYTSLATGGNRLSETTYTHDGYGRVTSVSDVPDTSNASLDSCTTTTYATNTSAWILDLPTEVQVVDVPCGTSPSLPGDAVSDNLTFYDGATSLSSDTPSKGNVTTTQKATSYNGSSPVYTTQATKTYDEYGRVLTAADADNRKTSTSYSPATGAEPTSASIKDAMGMVTSTTYDPARDLPLSVTTPAGWVTTKQYDALGRVTAEWTPGHPTSSNADYRYSYSVSATAPSVTTTSTLEPDGTDYLPSEQIYDSLGRQRETQSETADGNRTVTDSRFNADGWTILQASAYYATGAPSGTLVAAPDDQIPGETGYVYDGTGRVTKKISYALSNETWETDSIYGGDYTTVSYKNLVAGAPTGGTPQTTFIDGEGQTTAIYQYHAGVPADPTDPAADYDKTSYTYTPAKHLASITDASGNQWSYTYNVAGDQLTQADPDAGTSTSAYDAAGQLMSITDARGKQTSYTYDSDGRKSAEYDTTGGAAENSSSELASWAYDSIAKGQLTSSSSYYNGQAYTQQVLGYDSYGLPTGTETIIPSSQGALAGTYVTEDNYDTVGLLSSYSDVAAGGLPTETVGYGYDAASEQTSMTGTYAYVSNLSYTELGQPLEYTLGSASNAWTTDTWDPETGNLNEQRTQTGTTPSTVDDQHYAYDNTGQVTSEADTPSGDPSVSQVQCFQYDYLGRLSQAWSQGSTGCAATPSASVLGGAQAYWEQLSYDASGNITSNNYTYGAPGSQSTVGYSDSYPAAGGAGPHQLTGQLVTSSVYGYWNDTQSFDPSGHLSQATTPQQTETFSWDDPGRLSSVTSTPNSGSTSTTGYIYDADGNLLVQSDPGTTTLYLDGEQIVSTAGSGSLTGTRYYSIGGVTVAARESSGSVSYLIADRQGTSQVGIDAQSLAATRRYFGPYGQQLGLPPASWPGTKGYVGGTADPATGLTNLGAREYNPVNGQFITADPVLKPNDPQDFNPYAYAEDNPSTNSDPSGAMVCDGSVCGSIQCFISGPCGGHHSAPSAPPAPHYAPITYDPFRNDPALGNPAIYGADVWGPAIYAVPKPKPPVRHNNQVTGGAPYDGYTCARFGVGCGNFHPQVSHGGGGGFNLWHWVTRTAAPFVVHHWRQIATVAGFGVCMLATAGICVAYGVAYSVVDYVANGVDNHSNFRTGIPSLILGVASSFAYGYFGKVAGGDLASYGEKKASQEAFSMTKGWWHGTPLIRAAGSTSLRDLNVGRTATTMFIGVQFSAFQCIATLSCGN